MLSGMEDDQDGSASGNLFWNIFFVTTKSDVSKRMFLIVVMVIAIAPRMPLDEPLPWSIGGNLSHSFRKLVLFTGMCSMVRNTVLKDEFGGLSLVLLAVEGVSVTFLSLLTPYLLRVWIEERINIPGGRLPGKGLMPWVRSFVVLNLVGVLLRTFTHRTELWMFKKLADMLSFIPVMRTLKMYNSVTVGQVRYPGRGSVLTQVVVVAECYALFVNGCDVLSKALEFSGLLDASTFNDMPLMQGLFLNIFYATYTRILCHSIMLNILDEAYTIGSSGGGGGGGGAGNNGASSPTANRDTDRDQDGPDIEMVDDNGDCEKQMVALVPRK